MGTGARCERRSRACVSLLLQHGIAMASSAPMTVTSASLPEREQVRPGAVTPAERSTMSASKRGHGVHPKRKSPRRRSEVDEVYRANAIGELKNVQAVACHVFLRGMHFRHQGGRDRRQSASAASESVLGPGIPVFCGECLFRDRTLGPATGPSDRARA